MPIIHPKRRLKNGGLAHEFDDDLPILFDAGVRVVVSLVYNPEDEPLFTSAGFVHACLPVPDGYSPTLDQTSRFVTVVDDHLSQRRPVAVHCVAGRGRTGTILAAYLIAKGADVRSAITQIRAAQPVAIETKRQLQFLNEFAEAWKGASPAVQQASDLKGRRD